MPDFPSIARHSLMEPNYGSFGSSVRDPPYTCAADPPCPVPWMHQRLWPLWIHRALGLKPCGFDWDYMT